ncbi:MAG: radical SAM protein [Nitrospirae bacterium]|nr:radical SAM protein [Candidatus Manganitrophaceae bacterium]
MRQPGDILLISCYELGHQPIGIAMPMGFLKRAGYAPEGIDLSVEKLDLEKVRRAVWIGIAVPMHTALRIGARVLARVREINPRCHVAFFGLYASLNEGFLLAQGADSVIGGEYEGPLLTLIERLSAGPAGAVDADDSIEGVSRKKGRRSPLLDHLPFAVPDRQALPPLAQYAQLEENGVRRTAGYVEASRGCRHLCRHCPIPPVYDGRFFLIPYETVLEDIRNLVRLGATHITFGDPDFLNGPNHSFRIVRAMHDAFPELTFDFTAKVEHLLKHRTLIPAFASLGGRFIISAVESLSETVLLHLAKNHTRADILEALKTVREAGMALRPSLVPFTPWTTLDDMADLFHFVEREGLIDAIDPVQYSIRLLVPPGSLFLTEASMAPHLGPLAQERFTYQWRHPDPRMDALQKEISRWVEQGTAAEEDPAILFYRLKERVAALQEGRPPRPVDVTVDPNRAKPPRLTEPWFCCAEPTENQFAILEASDKIL